MGFSSLRRRHQQIQDRHQERFWVARDLALRYSSLSLHGFFRMSSVMAPTPADGAKSVAKFGRWVSGFEQFTFFVAWQLATFAFLPPSKCLCGATLATSVACMLVAVTADNLAVALLTVFFAASRRGCTVKIAAVGLLTSCLCTFFP